VEYCVGFEFGCDSSPIFGYEVWMFVIERNGEQRW
jgi:hypothetical protein